MSDVVAPQAMALVPSALTEIGERVPVPTYDRSAVTLGIVHFGMGGFHRAHEAMYTDALLAGADTALLSAIEVSVRPVPP